MTARNPRRNPYVGPRPFGRDDPLPARRREVRELCDLWLSERIVLLHSPSGAGKTSLIEADNGLRVALREEELHLLPTVRVNHAVPAGSSATNRYVLSVLRSLEEDRPAAGRLPVERLAGMELSEYLDARRAPAVSDGAGPEASASVARVGLIFDQFEEILTADPTDIAGRTEFFRQAGAALEARHRLALFVIREDHLGALEPWFRRLPTHMAQRYRLDLLGASGAKEAIVRPAAAEGVSFEADAVDRMVDDLRRVLVQNAEGKLEPQLGPWVEPVQLQVVCFRLWEQLAAEDRSIDVGEVEVLGDVNVALGAYYSEKIAAVEQRTGVSERRLRAWVGDELLSPQGYRTQVMRGQGSTEGLDNRALDALEDAHLVRAQQRYGQRWYELAHDRLVTPVREDNERWARENLHSVQVQAALWAREGKPESLLLPEAALAGAEAWAAAQGGELEEPERSFLAASRKARAEEQALRQAQADALSVARELAEERARAAVRRRYTRVIGGLGLLATIAAGLSSWQYVVARAAREESVAQTEVARAAMEEAVAQTGKATRARMEAEDQAKRAEDQAKRARDQTRMVAVAEARGDPTVQAVLLREVESPDSTRGWLSAVIAGSLSPKAWVVLRGHEDAIRSGVFSPDGRRLLTASWDGTARIWPTDGQGEPVVLRGHQGAVWSARFSPDGSQVLTASRDGTARLWPADGSGEPVVLTGHRRHVLSAAFSPAGDRVVTASADDTARVWSTEGVRLAVLHKHKSDVWSAEFSPDGSRVVTASADKTAIVWTSADGTATGWGSKAAPGTDVLEGHAGEVLSAEFSPDGARVVTASKDGTARVWAADGRGRSVVLKGHEGEVVAARFSPDGSRIVTASADKTARVWAVEGRELVVLRGFQDGVVAAEFSPDGEQVATGSTDGTARVWSADGRGEPLVLRGHISTVSSVVFSPDGRRLATTSWDGTARVWSTSGQGELVMLRGHTGAVQSAVFASGGERVLTTSEDGTARVWRVDGSEVLVVPPRPLRATPLAAISPDGTRVVTVFGKTAQVWRVDGKEAPKELIGHNDDIVAVVCSDARVVTASKDTTARVWSWNGDLEGELTGHSGYLNTVSLAADGLGVVTTSWDGTARVWRWDGRWESRELPHGGLVTSASFAPDGRVLTTGDGTAQVWSAVGSERTAQAWSAGEKPVTLRGSDGPAAFSPDGRRVLTASWEGTLRVWSADGQGEPVVLSGHRARVLSVGFSPDSSRVVSASEDGTARVWPADGRGEVLVLPGLAGGVRSAWFSPDGRQVLLASASVALIVPLHPSEASSLWRATSYCLTVGDRREMLQETDEEAKARNSSCTSKVREYAAQGAYEPALPPI